MNKHTEAHYSRLKNARVIGIEEGNDGIVGLALQLADERHSVVIAWVLRDPEGNGPGWLDIEEDVLE